MSNQLEVKIRDVLTGEDRWYPVIKVMVLVSQQGPMPCLLYLNDKSELTLCLGSPVIRGRLWSQTQQRDINFEA